MKLIVILPKRFDQKNLNEPHRDLVQIEIQNISTNLNLSVALNKKVMNFIAKKARMWKTDMISTLSAIG